MTRPLHEQGLQAWVASIMTPLGLTPTIYSDEGAPRRKPPYVAILITADVQVGLPERRDSYSIGDDKVTNIIKLTRSGVVDIAIFGEGHASAAVALVASTWRQTTLDMLESYGLSVSPATPGGAVIRLSTDSDGVTETRSVVSFTFGWAFIDAQETDDWIEDAVLTGDVN